MERSDSHVSTYQTKLKGGLFVWIKESDLNSNWERFKIHSVAKNSWANLLRQGEVEPSHSRQLLPKGRWFVCSSQEPINGITDPDELNEIEYRLFQQAIGKGEIGHASGTDDDKESNIIDLFEELGVPERRSKPTLLNEYEAEVQEGPSFCRDPMTETMTKRSNSQKIKKALVDVQIIQICSNIT